MMSDDKDIIRLGGREAFVYPGLKKMLSDGKSVKEAIDTIKKAATSIWDDGQVDFVSLERALGK